MGSTVFPAAASGPTLAEITAAGTAANWGASGETWTLLNRKEYTGGYDWGYTYTGLSGYKKYKIKINGLSSAAGRTPAVAFNSTSPANNCSHVLKYRTMNAPSNLYTDTATNYYGVPLAPAACSDLRRAEVVIDNANSTTAAKTMTMTGAVYGSGILYDLEQGYGVFNSTSPISTIYLLLTPYSVGQSNFVSNGSDYAMVQNGHGFVELWGGN